MINNESNNVVIIPANKKNTFLFIFITACFVTIITIYLAYFLSHIRPNKTVNILTQISADYQMESYMIMHLQKAADEKSDNHKEFEKEILPGIIMSAKATKNQDNDCVFSISCNGSDGFYRGFKVKGNHSNPSKLIYLD